MRVYVQLDDSERPAEVLITEKAMAQVRASFNPSGMETVDRAKLLCAALLSESEAAAASEHARDEERRCAAIARTHIETGAMFLVKALTTPPAPTPAEPASQTV